MNIDLSTNYMGFKTAFTAGRRSLSALGRFGQSEENGRCWRGGGGSSFSFEEQIRYERYELHHYMTQATESYPEALTSNTYCYYVLRLRRIAVMIGTLFDLSGCRADWLRHT